MISSTNSCERGSILMQVGNGSSGCTGAVVMTPPSTSTAVMGATVLFASLASFRSANRAVIGVAPAGSVGFGARSVGGGAGFFLRAESAFADKLPCNLCVSCLDANSLASSLSRIAFSGLRGTDFPTPFRERRLAGEMECPVELGERLLRPGDRTDRWDFTVDPVVSVVIHDGALLTP